MNEALLTKDDNQQIAQFVSYGKPTVVSVSVPTTAVRVDSGERRMSIKLKSIAANTAKVYVGFSNAVTAANGDEIAPSSAEVYDIANGDGREIWMIAESGTQDIRVVEI